jgi:hypothetical protein
MSEAVHAVNDQITDAVAQVNAAVQGMQVPFATGAACHAIAHALSLALHNAVLRQQHSHILRNALTTAAANAMLEGRMEQGEAVMKLAESPLVNPSLDTEIAQLRGAISGLQSEIDNIMNGAGKAPAPGTAPT